MVDDLKTVGMKTRRRILGDMHVDRASSDVTAFDEPFQELITEGAWGRVWSRTDIGSRERSMLTIALLAAQGHWEELRMHIRATKNTGATPDDIREALLHVAIYCGVPAANRAIKEARKAYAEIGMDV